jgi:alginate lyase/heparinase II/III-like protein
MAHYPPRALILLLPLVTLLPGGAEPGSGGLTNAAQPRYGARASVTAGPGARKDPRTEPEAVLDNNTHTRQVMTGIPYTFTVELPFRILVDRLAFAQSDYATEQAPRDLEIALDDGTVIRHTLELKRPEKRKPVWQEVPVRKEVKTVRVTVLSNYPGGEKVNWGGLAEIAVLTSANLEERFRIPGYDPAARTFVHAPPVQPAVQPKVRLPEVAKPGEHPRLVLTPKEVEELRAALGASERGKAALATLLGVANGALQREVEFPDPKGPQAQVKDRGDEVAKKHDRLSLAAGTLGVAYALTGDVKYARRARSILVGYAERYAAYPEHQGVNKSDTGKVMGQRLSEAMWLIPLIESYDYLFNSGVLTAAEKKQIQEQLLRPAITFIRRKAPAAEAAERSRRSPNWRMEQPAPGDGKAVGNWLIFYNTATIMAGAVMGDQDMIDVAAADFRTLLAQGIGSDGMWGEGAIGYQMFALTALVPGLETAAHHGIDLWSFGRSRVKMLFDSPLRYAYPDGTAPGINDSGRARFGDWSTMVYDYGYLRYGDPEYAFLVNASPRQLQMSQAVYSPTRIYQPLPEPQAARYPSTVFGNLGYAILRSANVYALLDYGPHGGVHGHFDKLNLILFASGEGKGDEIGGEPVFHRYEDPLHGEWTKQTVAHNTMAVDQTSQVPSTGKLLVFEDTPRVKVMRAEATASVPGALLDRTVIVAPDAVLDLYHGRSPYPRVWDRTFRFQGSLLQLPGAVEATQPLGARDGFQHIRVAARRPGGEMWQGSWQTKAGQFQVTLAGAPGQQVMLGTGPDKEQLALARQEGERATFAAVYGMEAWRNPVRSARLAARDDPQVVALEMKQEDSAITRVVVSHAVGPWQALGWRSDARVLYLRERGPELTVLLLGGTFVQAEEGGSKVEVRRALPGNYSAELRGGKLEIVSEWSE